LLVFTCFVLFLLFLRMLYPGFIISLFLCTIHVKLTKNKEIK